MSLTYNNNILKKKTFLKIKCILNSIKFSCKTKVLNNKSLFLITLYKGLKTDLILSIVYKKKKLKYFLINKNNKTNKIKVRYLTKKNIWFKNLIMKTFFSNRKNSVILLYRNQIFSFFKLIYLILFNLRKKKKKMKIFSNTTKMKIKKKFI